MEELDIIPIKGMSFECFKKIIRKYVLEFRDEWNEDEWHDQYVMFREAVSIWKEEYIKSHSSKTIVCEWGWVFYTGWCFATHNARVFKKDKGWYDAEITIPEELKLYYIFTDAEMQATAVYEQKVGWYLDYTLEKIEVVDPGAPELGPTKVTHFREVYPNPKHLKNSPLK